MTTGAVYVDIPSDHQVSMNRFTTFRHSAARWLIAPSSMLLLSACSVFQAPDEPGYQRASQIRNLEVPPDLTTPSGSGGIPEVVSAEASAGDLEGFENFKQFEQWEEFEQYRQWKAQGGAEEQLDFQAFVEARRAVQQEGSDGAGVSVENNFDQSRDVRVRATAESTMSFIDAALAAMDVTVLNVSPDDYRFDISLPEVRASTLFRPNADEFSLQVGRDQQDMVVALVDGNGERVSSPPAGQFMNRLAGQLRLAKVRLEVENRVAASRQARGTMRTTPVGHLELDLPDDSQLVWSQVDYVIDQIGFTVIERNPEDLSFRIRYLTDDQIPEEREGLEKLAFWKKDQELAEGADVYAVEITDTGTSSVLRVVDATGQPSETADTILGLLREKL